MQEYHGLAGPKATIEVRPGNTVDIDMASPQARETAHPMQQQRNELLRENKTQNKNSNQQTDRQQYNVRS
jgi:hypothetical protein